MGSHPAQAADRATAAFGYPFTYWVGMDTDPRTTPEALVEFNRFYSTTHVGEVIAAHPGFVSATRFELIEPDPRGGAHRGPRWLAVYGMRDEAAAEQYVKDNARPWLHRRRYSPWPPARKKAKTVWRLLWRQLAFAVTAADQAPESVVLVGTNEPAEVADGRLAELELYLEFAHPAPGCPGCCAIYAEPPAATREQDGATWRLVYRRIPPPAPGPA